MSNLILIFLLIYFSKVAHIFSQDAYHIVTHDVHEIPMTIDGTITTDTNQPRFRSQLLQKYMMRPKVPPEPIKDFAESKLSYIRRGDGLSTPSSQQLTETDEDFKPVESRDPSTSRPHVSFSESRTREYKPGSGTLLNSKEEVVKKIEETCWDNFGTVVLNDPSHQLQKPNTQDVQMLSVEDHKDFSEVSMEAQELPKVSNASVEMLSKYGNPLEDLEQDHEILPGMIPDREAFEDSGQLAIPVSHFSTLTAESTIGTKDIGPKRKIRKGKSATCSGCVVS